MKRTIRRNVFETNSSSTHSITMCDKNDFDKWVNGELVWSRWDEELVELTDEVKKARDENTHEYLTYEEFNDWQYIDNETYKCKHTTASGEVVVAFGYYGNDY